MQIHGKPANRDEPGMHMRRPGNIGGPASLVMHIFAAAVEARELSTSRRSGPDTRRSNRPENTCPEPEGAGQP
jgi:hypothetical protein